MTDATLNSVDVRQSPRLGARALQLYLTIVIPPLLVLISARVVMTPLFLQLEYTRPAFPADFYGFTMRDRLTYAPYALNYLFNGEGIAYLGDLTFPDGAPLFNERELRHMVDVKVVTQAAFGFALAAGIGALAAVYILGRRPETRPYLYAGLLRGGLITLGLVAAVIILAVTAWDLFFTGFHNLFFADGTWQFLYSDTLIRLFPEQFWFDAAIVVGGLTVIGALVLTVIGLGNRVVWR